MKEREEGRHTTQHPSRKKNGNGAVAQRHRTLLPLRELSMSDIHKIVGIVYPFPFYVRQIYTVWPQDSPQEMERN